jgi:hypothetical protein
MIWLDGTMNCRPVFTYLVMYYGDKVLSCSHRGLQRTEGLSVVKACSRYGAIYRESC